MCSSAMTDDPIGDRIYAQKAGNEPRSIRQQIDNLLLAYPELAEDEILRGDMVEGATDAHEFLRMIERRRQDAECMTDAIAANITAMANARRG